MHKRYRPARFKKKSSILPQLAILAFIAALIGLSFVGCGKDGSQGAKGDKGNKGDAGEAGADAVLSAYTITSIVDPCGDAPGIIDEVLLVLANGQVLVSFSANANGKDTRFAILPPGAYATTDGSGCAFTVNVDGTIN